MVSKGRNNDQKEPDHQIKKPVKAHKKEIEGIKYKQHEEMNDSSLKNEDAKQPESSPAPKVEEKEAKFKDTHIPNAFISETRSEGGIEDQHKLDQLSGKEDPQIFEETKSKRSNDKRNKNKHKKRKQWSKKQNQDSKGENKQNKQSKNSWNNDISDVAFHKQASSDAHMQKKQLGPDMFYPNPAFKFENQSNMSEDRNIGNIQKGVRSTNPTSETSSFKGSSVFSNPDAQLSKSASRKRNEGNEVLRSAKSGKKNENKKRGKDGK